MRNTRILRVAATVVSALALTLAVGALPAQAAKPAFICEPLDSGKIDTVGDPETVTVTAPDGKLIDGYCVKAGTTKYFVPVVPPQKTVVIDHPDKDSVSHYSVSYVEPTTPEPEKVAIPGSPAWVDKCGIDADGFTLPEDTDDIDWSSSGLAAGVETLTATVKGDKTFTDGTKTKTFEHTFTDESCTPPEPGTCEVTTSVVTTDLATWDLSQTKKTGHNELVDGGLRIWTEGATSEDKAAGYFSTDFPLIDAGATSIADALDYTATTGIEPGLQLVIDADDDGSVDGILVGEAVYGQNWWLSGGAKQFVKDSAPNTGGGNGSDWFGTIVQWAAAFPDATVDAIGYSLGSGVHGDGVITRITLGCVDYTFDATPPPTGPATPTLAGSFATGTCEADSPWIDFDVELTDPDNTVKNRTASLVLTDGTNTKTIVLGDLKGGSLTGSVLWPGASVDEDGKADGWPGWTLVDGKWVETDGNFAWTRGAITAKLVVNPEVPVTISYPKATPECAAGPTTTPPTTPPGGGEGGAPAASDGTNLASTGFAGTSIAIVAGIIVIAGLAFLVAARIRRRKSA
ncbi:hypothetical protein [Agromyces cerinus]|uniref:LPXTG-motif cell wall anchor domain-containing protein n=1 Tax=Agromyces cerinus subsp. cerinus TaxID=232089 RepID=A0A1N6HDC7_9MICO|nr:hypothetical protein [Agromyces cerinus]SIO17655.1 hypothetical protein SAMN05443544_3082 [Agromyces cerinus subsp. cerinus]